MFESATEISRENSLEPIDPSHEIDQLLIDLDLVLRCRCCEPRDGFFAAESWATADTPVFCGIIVE